MSASTRSFSLIEPERDFSCLDFDFYLTLAAKLHLNIGDAESTLFSSNGVFSERSGTNGTSARSILQLYRIRLEEVIASLLQENQFSAELLLEELVAMDETMKQLWLGRIPEGILSISPTTHIEDEDDNYDSTHEEHLHPRSNHQGDFSLEFSRRRGPSSKAKKRN